MSYPKEDSDEENIKDINDDLEIIKEEEADIIYLELARSLIINFEKYSKPTLC
jgi:hypothetical protein